MNLGTPSPRVIDIGDHLRDEIRWLLFYRSNRPNLFKRGDRVRLDLSKASFIIPFCLLSFLAYCKSLSRRTKHRVALCNIPTNPPIYQYMERTDFFVLASRYLEIEGDYSAVSLWNRDIASQKLLGIVEIGRNRIDSALKIAQTISELKKRYEEILGFFERTHSNAELFFTILSEIAANIPEHSKSTGYLLVQKYESLKKSTVFTSVSIMDTGVGIRRRLREQIRRRQKNPGRKLVKDSDYLEFAFSENATRSGAGLHSVVQSLSRWHPNDTALLAVSGKAVLYKPQGKPDFSFSNEELGFTGTHITLWFYGDLHT